VSTPRLVEEFYTRIWNGGDLDGVTEILDAEFTFRGSLGTELTGHDAFKSYVRSVRESLSDYHCEILACVSEGDRAFAQMLFSGRHTGSFRGHAPTGKRVHWMGAALFRLEQDRIADVWVLGDLIGLDAVLRQNQ
jgi:predicted ester cyclase